MVTFLGWDGAREEVLFVSTGTGIISEAAITTTDTSLDNAVWHVKTSFRARQQLGHCRPPNWRCHVRSTAVHDFIIIVTNPHADSVLRGIANRPGIAVIIGGTRLDSDRFAAHREAAAKHPRPRSVVRQDARDEIGAALADSLACVRCFPRNIFVEFVLDFGDEIERFVLRTAIGKGRVGVSHLAQAHLGRAKRQ